MASPTQALHYVPLEPIPSNIPPTGGDSLTQNLNLYYETGNIAWMVTATALVLLMIPGVGFFYSGLARRKSALSLLWLSLMGTAVVSLQWFFWGFSLAFSHHASKFIGNFDFLGLHNALGAPWGPLNTIPDLLFAVFQGMFAAITVVIAVGAVAERGRMLPCILYIFIWSTVIYDPIACWTWNPHGWSNRLGTLDFAGGTPVHISSGCAALAYSYMLGKRRGHGTQELNYRPHNVTHIVIGTVFLWVGWFGFNSGSAMGANLRAVMAAVVTNLSASVGGMTWCLVDFRLERKWSTVGFCSGVVAGLVCITPGSGFVPAWAAVVYGVVAGVACNYATKLKYFFRCDDALDIFAVHAIGGFCGNILTAFFAADYIAALDGVTKIPGGFLNHNYVQIGYQLSNSFAGGTYSFLGTCIILAILDFIGKWVPALKLRASEEEEILGIDDVEIGEFAYDYVELSREVKTIDDMEDSRHEDTMKSNDSSRPFGRLVDSHVY